MEKSKGKALPVFVLEETTCTKRLRIDDYEASLFHEL
jgi:hypothetical protein